MSKQELWQKAAEMSWDSDHPLHLSDEAHCADLALQVLTNNHPSKEWVEDLLKSAAKELGMKLEKELMPESCQPRDMNDPELSGWLVC